MRDRSEAHFDRLIEMLGRLAAALLVGGGIIMTLAIAA